MKTLTSKGYKALMLTCLVLVSPVACADTAPDAEYLDAACEGRYPGRYVELDNDMSYDCQTGETVATATADE